MLFGTIYCQIVALKRVLLGIMLSNSGTKKGAIGKDTFKKWHKKGAIGKWLYDKRPSNSVFVNGEIRGELESAVLGW